MEPTKIILKSIATSLLSSKTSHRNSVTFHEDCNKFLTSCNSWPFIGAPYIYASTSGSNPKRSYSERETQTTTESSSESSEPILSVDADFNIDSKECNNLIHILSQPYMTNLRKEGVFDFEAEAEAEASLDSKKRRGNFISFSWISSLSGIF